MWVVLFGGWVIACCVIYVIRGLGYCVLGYMCYVGCVIGYVCYVIYGLCWVCI